MLLAFCLKRRISMFRMLQRLSRGRVALHKGDIPKVLEECCPRLLFWGGLTCYTSCVACARIRDAGVFACLSDLIRVGRMGRPGTSLRTTFTRSDLTTVYRIAIVSLLHSCPRTTMGGPHYIITILRYSSRGRPIVNQHRECSRLASQQRTRSRKCMYTTSRQSL
jgi:hypothetical protein